MSMHHRAFCTTDVVYAWARECRPLLSDDECHDVADAICAAIRRGIRNKVEFANITNSDICDFLLLLADNEIQLNMTGKMFSLDDLIPTEVVTHPLYRCVEHHLMHARRLTQQDGPGEVALITLGNNVVWAPAHRGKQQKMNADLLISGERVQVKKNGTNLTAKSNKLNEYKRDESLIVLMVAPRPRAQKTKQECTILAASYDPFQCGMLVKDSYVIRDLYEHKQAENKMRDIANAKLAQERLERKQQRELKRLNKKR